MGRTNPANDSFHILSEDNIYINTPSGYTTSIANAFKLYSTLEMNSEIQNFAFTDARKTQIETNTNNIETNTNNISTNTNNIGTNTSAISTINSNSQGGRASPAGPRDPVLCSLLALQPRCAAPTCIVALNISLLHSPHPNLPDLPHPPTLEFTDTAPNDLTSACAI